MDWFTADLHFRHNNIVKHSRRTLFMSEQERAVVESGDQREVERLRISRETTDRMNDGFTDEINRVVQPNDHLWILGDFAYPVEAIVHKRCAECIASTETDSTVGACSSCGVIMIRSRNPRPESLSVVSSVARMIS